MQGKNIVHIIFSLCTGGAENIMIDMANAQSNFHTVSIIIINDNYELEMIQKLKSNIRIISLNRREGSRNVYKFFTLNKYLLQIKPKIIHCHNYNIISFILYYRNRTIYTIHDVGVSFKHFHKYKKIVAISQAVYNDVKCRSNGKFLPVVINNSINIDDIVPRQNFILHSPIRIIQVSRLEHAKKGQDILLHAIAILVHKYNYKVKVTFIGTGASFNFLQQLAHQLNLTNEVEFLLNKSRAWIFENLQTYDILVQPSLYEGFGLTILEAMAAQIPVIASNIDGPAYIIDNNKYGYLFENKNSLKLADTIVQVISDYNNNVKAKIILARKRVENEYSIQTLLGKYEEVYTTIFD